MARAAHSDKLTDANIVKVIELLEAEKPITKKAACEILGIAYNTTRLGELIQKFKDKREARKAHMAAKRGKPASLDEITDIVKSYLQGGSLTDIADENFRGTQFVKTVLESHGVPIRSSSNDYWNPPMIPDEGVKREFDPGERCYSARYQSLAKVCEKLVQNGNEVYRVWLEAEEQQQYAYQPWWELGSLDKIRQSGVNI